MTKVCTICKEGKSSTAFYSNGQGYLLNKCKQCQIQLNRVRRKADPGKYKDMDLKQTFGINLEQYNSMFYNQQGKCAICLVHQSELKKALSVDHCHTTNLVRGLLCGNCNQGLGHFKDSTTSLARAMEYLRTGSAEQTDMPRLYVVRK